MATTDDSNGGGQKIEDTQRRPEGKEKTSEVNNAMMERLHEHLMKVQEA